MVELLWGLDSCVVEWGRRLLGNTLGPRLETPGLVAFSSSAHQHRGRCMGVGGKNVWTDPRLVIGQLEPEERSLWHGSCQEEYKRDSLTTNPSITGRETRMEDW